MRAQLGLHRVEAHTPHRRRSPIPCIKRLHTPPHSNQVPPSLATVEKARLDPRLLNCRRWMSRGKVQTNATPRHFALCAHAFTPPSHPHQTHAKAHRQCQCTRMAAREEKSRWDCVHPNPRLCTRASKSHAPPNATEPSPFPSLRSHQVITQGPPTARMHPYNLHNNRPQRVMRQE